MRDVPENMRLGANLRRYRENNEMTQKEVANKLGVAKSTISNWETGRFYPTLPMLYQLAKLYKVSTCHLILGTEIDNDIELFLESLPHNLVDTVVTKIENTLNNAITQESRRRPPPDIF